MDKFKRTTENLPGTILSGPASGLSDRGRRLFACACVRDIEPYLTDDRSRRALSAAAAYAEERIDSETLGRAFAEADAAFRATCVYGASTGDQAMRAASLAAAPDPVDPSHVCYCCGVVYCYQATGGFTAGEPAEAAAWTAVKQLQFERLRSILEIDSEPGEGGLPAGSGRGQG